MNSEEVNESVIVTERLEPRDESACSTPCEPGNTTLVKPDQVDESVLGGVVESDPTVEELVEEVGIDEINATNSTESRELPRRSSRVRRAPDRLNLSHVCQERNNDQFKRVSLVLSVVEELQKALESFFVQMGYSEPSMSHSNPKVSLELGLRPSVSGFDDCGLQEVVVIKH